MEEGKQTKTEGRPPTRKDRRKLEKKRFESNCTRRAAGRLSARLSSVVVGNEELALVGGWATDRLTHLQLSGSLEFSFLSDD